MMNRDPVVGFTQRKSITNYYESSPIKEQDKNEEIIETNDQERLELELAINKSLEDQQESIVEINDEERLALELAIKKSLEDQQESIVEINNEVSNTIESSSNSDGKLNKINNIKIHFLFLLHRL